MDKTSLISALVAPSDLVVDVGYLISELDSNPLAVDEQRCLALDALVVPTAALSGAGPPM